MIEPDFWSTSAQTMPVLALAIVVEARAVMAKWERGRRMLWKTLQGLLWGVPLVIYGVATPLCMSALGGSWAWPALRWLIPISIGIGMLSLVLVPAGEVIIRSNAGSIAYASFVARGGPVMRTRHLRRLRLSSQAIEKALDSVNKQEEMLTVQCQAFKGTRPGADQATDERLAEISGQLKVLEDLKFHLQSTLQDYVDLRVGFDSSVNEIRDRFVNRVEGSLDPIRNSSASSEEGRGSS